MLQRKVIITGTTPYSNIFFPKYQYKSETYKVLRLFEFLNTTGIQGTVIIYQPSITVLMYIAIILPLY